MPAFNSAGYIEDAIRSILNQTYSYFELIVVDDGSVDKTVEIICAFKDSRIKMVKHDVNRGPAAARNTGILAASAESLWLALIDSDDQWMPNRLSSLLALARDDLFVADNKLLAVNTSRGLVGYPAYYFNQRAGRRAQSENGTGFNDFLRLGAPVLQPVVP